MPVLKVEYCSSLTGELIEKLRCASIFTVASFVAADLEQISFRIKVSYKDLQSIRRVLLAEFSAFPVNAAQLYDDMVFSVTILTTGIQSIDTLMDGGYYCAEFTELIGPSGVGKSQLCMLSSISVAMTTDYTVLYIDTGGGFHIQRVRDILCAKCTDNQKSDDILGRICHSSAFDIFDLYQALDTVTDGLKQQNDNFYRKLKLVVIDSIPSVISPVLGGKTTDGHSHMTQIGVQLKKIASEYSIAVLVTNNSVSASWDTHNSAVKPALGQSWAYVPHTRLSFDYLGKHPTLADDPSRLATLIKSTKQKIGKSVEFSMHEFMK